VGDSLRRGEGDRGGELDLARALAQRLEQSFDHRLGLTVEDHRDQLPAPAPATAPVCAGGKGFRKIVEGALKQVGEVDGVAPRVGLLHPLGARELRGQRREHRLGTLPPCDVERFERLVDEVERMAAVQIAVVGRRREQHVGELARRSPAADR